ncbi:MAG: ABC transporter substrate-binding protein [Sarcina sp.]
MLKKKILVLVTALIVSAGMFISCGEKTTDVSANVAQEIVVGDNKDLGGYDPAKEMSDFVRPLVYDTLVALDQDFKKVPSLAQSWTMSEDGKEWTFKLREGVKFHDGEAWNAEAAKFNFETRIKAGSSALYKKIDSIKVEDDYTLKLIMKAPSFTLASELTAPFTSFVSPKGFDGEGNVTKAIGTGAFKVDSWEKDNNFILIKNSEYYGEKANLEKVTFKVIPDSNTRAMALEAGEIDVMSGREALTAVEKLKNNPDININKKMGQTSELIFINREKGELSNENIRKAIVHSINFEEMVPSILGDMAEVPQNFFSPAFGDFVDQNLKLPKFDINKAKDLLEKEGYKDTDGNGIVDKNGKDLKFSMSLDAKNEEDKNLSTVIQSDLAKAGIGLEIKTVDKAALTEDLSNKNYELIMVGQWHVPHDDPSTHYVDGYWHSKSKYNIFSSDELDKKIDRLANSLDNNERINLHKEIQKEILDTATVIPVFHRNNLLLSNKKVDNLSVSVGTWQIFKGLEEAKIK